MTRRETYEAKTEELLQPLVDAHGFELVDVEYVKEAGNWYLRAYIDKPGGIAVDDCEVISRALSDKLDEEDYIEDSYILEVSSPGLGRPLKKDKDFQRSIGKFGRSDQSGEGREPGKDGLPGILTEVFGFKRRDDGRPGFV